MGENIANRMIMNILQSNLSAKKPHLHLEDVKARENDCLVERYERRSGNSKRQVVFVLGVVKGMLPPAKVQMNGFSVRMKPS